MPETATFAPGTPVWVDLGTTDVEGSTRFYTGLFGWEAQGLGPEAGGYTMLKLGGKDAAALSPAQVPGQPTAWSVYIGTTDADTTAKKVRDSGGKVIVEPFDVLDAGRMAVFSDPGGAIFSVWQPGEHRGAEVSGQPGSLVWAELETRDPSAATGFYGTVFGWGTHVSAGPMEYTEWKLGDQSVAGMMRMDAKSIPAEVPPHWLVYFGAADADAVTAKAKGLGAQVLVPPTAISDGDMRFSVLRDPQGAVFGLLQMGRG